MMQAIYLYDSNPEGGFKILGAVKDFNASSLHDKIGQSFSALGQISAPYPFASTQRISPRW
ncbi:MAG: hypothetical protein ABI359_12140 [Ginsengibacter sp.]